MVPPYLRSPVPYHRRYLRKRRNLLSKKSWNVYNPSAIARVRADEAAAAAREEADEQRQHEYEAASRAAQLRGLKPPPAPGPEDDIFYPERYPKDGNARKRRRLQGEDDTDRDIRLAREEGHREKGQRASGRSFEGVDRDAPLTDHAGHIQLFRGPSTGEIRAEKRKGEEREKERRKREEEEQASLRFSNAGAKRGGVKERPWYAGGYSGTEVVDEKYAKALEEGEGKDAFGRPDPGRKQRDALRMSADDPLVIMKAAQAQIDQIKAKREAERLEQERQLAELEAQEREARREERRRRKRGERGERRAHDDVGRLEGFSLDGGYSEEQKSHRPRHRSRSRSPRRDDWSHHRHHYQHRHHDHHHRRHRSRSAEKDRRATR